MTRTTTDAAGEWLDLTRPFDGSAENSLALENPRIETTSDVDAVLLSVGLADRLVERDVALVAMDTLSPDEPRELRGNGDPSPVHRRLLRAGVPVVENLADPAELVGERVEMVCLPLRLRGGDGAPARVLARRLGD